MPYYKLTNTRNTRVDISSRYPCWQRFGIDIPSNIMSIYLDWANTNVGPGNIHYIDLLVILNNKKNNNPVSFKLISGKAFS